MSSLVHVASGGEKKNQSETGSIYLAALNAACLKLPAELSDLERLLDPIHSMQVPKQQVSALLQQVWRRLNTLRESRAEVVDQAGRHPAIARLLDLAFSRLQAGEAFSLDDADAAFEQAYRQCIVLGSAAELSASIRAVQAQIAAVQLAHRRAGSLYAEAATTAGLSMPLQWQYHARHALVLVDLGRDFLDATALEQAIELYETQVLALAPRLERPDDWAATQHDLGNALCALGQRQRGTWMLDKAIKAFGCALAERSRERAPLDWAATQDGLGNTLGVLAQRHADVEMLEQSVAVFQSALKERTRDRSPHDWAMTQNNIGTVLLALGQRKQDKTILRQASDAYKNVLQVWTREREPLEWAITMNNLSTALRMLGELRTGPRTLEQAVAACRSALAGITRALVPQTWAMTQNNLGAALYKLGERQHDVQALEAAADAYENALEEWTRERAPMAWAMTMANLCATRKLLAEQLGDIELVHSVLTDYAGVADVFRHASHAQYYELVTEQVALTRKLEQVLLNNALV